VVDCAKKQPPKPVLHSDVIEEVDTKQLEKLLEQTEYIAVLFCKFSSKL